MELVDFLRARLDEDEALAREAPEGPWHIGNAVDPMQPCNVHTFPGARLVADGLNWLVAEHIARHDPARVLADVEAKRALLADILTEPHATLRPGGSTAIYCAADSGLGDPCECGRDVRVSEYARLLARPFRDHPDFDPSWLEG